MVEFKDDGTATTPGQPQDSPVAMWFSERYSDAYMANRFQTMHIDPSKAGRM